MLPHQTGVGQTTVITVHTLPHFMVLKYKSLIKGEFETTKVIP